ncbi:VOC family protein [Flavobacterium sp.]|uniref:VOC family protein n=1 Tax=Flavobacterium sp. TaxID=239 RepID=UPI003752B381
MQKITPFLWYDGKAEEAALFYTSIFKNSCLENVNPMMTNFQLNGLHFSALNGGSLYKFSNAISLFVTCNSKEEIDYLWEKFSESGTVVMNLGSYPWNEKYGWIKDKYGLSWQLFLGDKEQEITPSLLFVNQQFGNAEAAINLYTSIFDGSKIISLSKYGDTTPEYKNNIIQAEFKLENQTFKAMESHANHDFQFNEAFSFVINCEDQKEVDFYWDKLTQDGGKESQCAWLKDKFGVSWQVVPKLLITLLNDKDREKSNRVMNAMLQMKKINCQKLQDAYDGK